MIKKYKTEILTFVLILIANLILFLVLAGISDDLVFKYVCEECTANLAWGCKRDICLIDDLIIKKLTAPFVTIIFYAVFTSKIISKQVYKYVYLAYIFILPLILFNLVRIENLDSYTTNIPKYLITEKIIIFSPSILFVLALLYFIKRGEKNDN